MQIFVQERQSSRLCEDFSRSLQFTEIQLLSEIVSAFHQSPVSSESEPVYVEPAREAQLDSSKVWTCKEAFQGLKISALTLGIHSTQKINDMTYNQGTSDPSTCVKKRTHRSNDLILLRHMDDVVGTGPEGHLMSVFEHMKTSLYLTEVVVLRNEGDPVTTFQVLRSPRDAGALR